MTRPCSKGQAQASLFYADTHRKKRAAAASHPQPNPGQPASLPCCWHVLPPIHNLSVSVSMTAFDSWDNFLSPPREAQWETRDPSTAGCFPHLALLNFRACPGTAGITEAQILRCLRKEVMLFFLPLGFLQGTFKSLDSHRASEGGSSTERVIWRKPIFGSLVKEIVMFLFFQVDSVHSFHEQLS